MRDPTRVGIFFLKDSIYIAFFGQSYIGLASNGTPTVTTVSAL